MFSVKKFHGGEVYTANDGKQYVKSGRGWAVVNELDHVLVGSGLVYIYTTKRVAQYEADRLNKAGVQEIVFHHIDNETDLMATVMQWSKANPKKYVTFYVMFDKTYLFIHERKPQSLNSGGVEDCIRRNGGFFRNGEVVPASKTLMKKFHFCPVLG